MTETTNQGAIDNIFVRRIRKVRDAENRNLADQRIAELRALITIYPAISYSDIESFAHRVADNTRLKNALVTAKKLNVPVALSSLGNKIREDDIILISPACTDEEIVVFMMGTT